MSSLHSETSSISSDLSWTQELEAALYGSTDGGDGGGVDVCAGARCRPLPDQLRPAGWLSCLDVRQHAATDGERALTVIYDLPDQQALRDDISRLVDRLGNDEYDRVSVMSDVETVLTHYCKTHQHSYTGARGGASRGDSHDGGGGGLVDIVLPLVTLKLTRNQLYRSLSTIVERYVPRNLACGGDEAYHLLRLLVLYHDPELCNFLDSHNISTDLFCRGWLSSLFSSSCRLSVILPLWDIFFQLNEPFLVFFLCLVILVNAKEQIVELRDSSRDQLISTIASLPSFLQVADLQDFCELAVIYLNNTPGSFKQRVSASLFGTAGPVCHANKYGEPLCQCLCLPVSGDELLRVTSAAVVADRASQLERKILSAPPHATVSPPHATLGSLGTANTAQMGFFVVDSRPAEQYNAGHLSCAYHLDCALMLSEPRAFATAVTALLAVKPHVTSDVTDDVSSRGGRHICFIGSGRETEDKHLHMAMASLLQKRTAFVSKVDGGYQAIHELLSDNLASLVDHCVAQCVSCQAAALTTESGQSTKPVSGGKSAGGSLFGLLGSGAGAVGWRERGRQMRAKIVDIVTNVPQTERELLKQQQQQQQQQHRHVSSQERGGRCYRNVANVFSLEDEQESDDDNMVSAEETNEFETVDVRQFLQHPDVLAHFACHHITENNSVYPSMLVVTKSQLVVLRHGASTSSSSSSSLTARTLDDAAASISVRRPLTKIVQITSKRRRPEMISIKYGMVDGSAMVVTDLDRFHVVKSGDATKAVKLAIMELAEPGITEPINKSSGNTDT